MRRIAVLLAMLALAGCATTRPPRNDERFALVRLGMTRDDALRLFGPPDEVMRFPLSGMESWDYLYVDSWGILVSHAVTFGPDGRVASRFARRLNDGGSDHGQ